jgi:hypothetical protein
MAAGSMAAAQSLPEVEKSGAGRRHLIGSLQCHRPEKLPTRCPLHSSSDTITTFLKYVREYTLPLVRDSLMTHEQMLMCRDAPE